MAKPIIEPIVAVKINEFGYNIFSGDPTEEQLQKIKLDTKKHIDRCEKQRKRVFQIQSDFYQRQWEIDHPFQSEWIKFPPNVSLFVLQSMKKGVK